MTTISMFINLLTIGTLFSSVLAITAKNPVISIIFVIATFVQAALYLILLGINFIGISYIVIYVGAIAVLFLFVIMMINIKLTDILETGNQYTKSLPLAIAIGLLSVFIYISMEIFSNFNNNSYLYAPINQLVKRNFENIDVILKVLNNKPDSSITKFTQIESLGHGLYSYDAILLIILSIILLLAMLATIIISKSNKVNN